MDTKVPVNTQIRELGSSWILLGPSGLCVVNDNAISLRVIFFLDIRSHTKIWIASNVAALLAHVRRSSEGYTPRGLFGLITRTSFQIRVASASNEAKQSAWV